MAIQLEYLPLTGAELPVSKIFTVGEESYTFIFRKNTRHDRIYCEIRDSDDNILYTTRLIYAANILNAVVDGLTMDDPIRPFNLNEIMTKRIIDTEVTPDNLDRVKMYVVA